MVHNKPTSSQIPRPQLNDGESTQPVSSTRGGVGTLVKARNQRRRNMLLVGLRCTIGIELINWGFWMKMGLSFLVQLIH